MIVAALFVYFTFAEYVAALQLMWEAILIRTELFALTNNLLKQAYPCSRKLPSDE